MIKNLWIAPLVGFGISVMLYGLFFVTQSILLLLPQLPGFLVCAAVRGMHGLSKPGSAVLVVPINAAVYATLIFLLIQKFMKLDSK